jgi:hypothetical protein
MVYARGSCTTEVGDLLTDRKWLRRVVGEAAVFHAYKIKSWARRTKCKLAWFRRTAGVIRLYLLQYDINTFSVKYLYFFPHCARAPSWPGPPHYRGFTITLRHTTLGRTPPDD